MSRNVKTGLEYFPFDVDFFQDIRIRKLIKRQGGKAVTVYALLLCLIYKNGYYMLWDDELPFIGSELSGFDEAYISEVIKSCLSLGLFAKNLFDSEGVLSSKGIQTRYCNIQRINKRMSRIDKYSLINSPEPAPVFVHDDVAPPIPPDTTDKSPSCDNKQWLDVFFSPDHTDMLKRLCKSIGITIDQIDRLRSVALNIINEWELSDSRHRDYNDFSRHLITLIKKSFRDDPAVKAPAASPLPETKSKPKPSPPDPEELRFRRLVPKRGKSFIFSYAQYSALELYKLSDSQISDFCREVINDKRSVPSISQLFSNS